MQQIASLALSLRRYAPKSIAALGGALLTLLSLPISAQSWPGYAGNPQHTARAHIAIQPLQRILWSTPVDLNPPYNGGELFIHYGTTLITRKNTVIVTVRRTINTPAGPGDAFQLEGRCGYCGKLKWTLPTNYKVPPHNWIPSCGSTLAPGNILYVPAAGGTILRCTGLDAAPISATRIAFYGIDNYRAAPHAFRNVYINTPITCDASGSLYFGFFVTGPEPHPLGLESGIARISATGQATWVSAAVAAGDTGITKVLHNCAPALSRDGKLVYIAVSNGDGFGFGTGYLLALDSTTLVTRGKVALMDVYNPTLPAFLADDGTASPTVGPDDDVYYGVLEDPFLSNNDRGWLLHFDRLLRKAKLPGAFGWDDTASIVPASAVPSYAGASSYLLLTKYNNYVGLGTGDGHNRVAVLDPNEAMMDPVTGAAVMNEVITVQGVTPDGITPTSVREWCINSAVVDPVTKGAVINSEDGTVYRWDFTTNMLSEKVPLTSATGEAYTPTVAGPDGIAYAVNNAILFAVGPNVVNVSQMFSVERGPLTLDRDTGRYIQKVTLTNASDCSVTGPVSLALDELSGNATLLNATGKTSATSPAGSPYIDLSPGNIAAGKRAAVILTFSNSDGSPITYKVRVLAGSGSR